MWFCFQVMEFAANGGASGSSAGSRVSVPELMQQLQVTQNELENIKVNAWIGFMIYFVVEIGWSFLKFMGFL